MKKFNMDCDNITGPDGENITKCLCGECRMFRLSGELKVSDKKPDLSRATEMERRKGIHENKNIW